MGARSTKEKNDTTNTASPPSQPTTRHTIQVPRTQPSELVRSRPTTRHSIQDLSTQPSESVRSRPSIRHTIQDPSTRSTSNTGDSVPGRSHRFDSSHGDSNRNDVVVLYSREQSNINDEDVSNSREQSNINDEDVSNSREQSNRNDEDVSNSREQSNRNDEDVSNSREQSNRNDEDVSNSREQTNERQTAMVCAAIDFGTTFSGYAYAFKADPNRIFINDWNGYKTKTPTVLLMTPDGQFSAFGQDAINQYTILIKSNAHKEWYYFEKFKMQLFVRDGPLDRDMEIEDILGKKMKAITIFSEAIKYIRQHMMDTLHQEQTDIGIIRDSDIRWILTVPAIWNDMSKLFMREAAKKAGIPSDLLTLALEPEAASLFCKKELGRGKISEGCKYMVADLGGGTADITCHEVQHDGTLKEIESPFGGDFGGTSVDNEYWQMLVSIFGGKVMKKFKKEHVDEYWEMMDDFDIKKKHFNSQHMVRIKFPAQLYEMHEQNVGEPLEKSIAQRQNPDVTFSQGRINIKGERMKALFNVAVNKVVNLVQELLEKIGSLDHIVLVGGFSESQYLQQVLRHEFNNILLLPNEPSMAVLQGAVIYGNDSNAISSRNCRYTYGIARLERFIPGSHPERKKVKMGKFVFCDDIFNKHIEIGTTVSLANADNAEYHEYFPALHNMNVAMLEVYKSKKKNPKFVDEDECKLVGYIKAEGINPHNDLWCKLLVRLIFGGTELIVEVRDEKNDIHILGYVDFFG